MFRKIQTLFDFYPTCLEKNKHVGIFTPGCFFPHMFGFWHICLGKGTHVWQKPHNYMFANVWHFPHMCGKSHRRAYFPLSYRWLSSIKYLYCQILIHHMYVLVHICFIKQWHTLVLCWNRLPVEILPLMSLNELSTDPSTDLRFLYLYPLCIYVFFVYIWISVFVHWRICVSVFSIICDITHYVYVVS